jgi:DNA-binding NarL/FixJ family response regulator
MTTLSVNGFRENGLARQAGDDSIRVLISHGDGLARKALRDALHEAGISVVGQCADTGQAATLAVRCAPDVVLVDGALPPGGGLAAMRTLATAAPRSRVVLLASSDADDTGLLALSQGAAGYLPREIELTSLARAIEGVVMGEAAISRSMAARLIECVRELSAGLSGMRPVQSPLTTREWEILEFLKAGDSTARIAEELILSPDTVRSHVQNILRKLKVHSRAEAVEIADRSRVPLGISG